MTSQQPRKRRVRPAEGARVLATGLSVLIGSMAAYALSRVEYAPNLITILFFVFLVAMAGVSVGIYKVDWRIAAAVVVALFFFLQRVDKLENNIRVLRFEFFQ